MSNINYTNIDGNYPVAGQDNDSQGFRNNFTNIKNNLRYAFDELTELQSKAVLKSPLIGAPLNNDSNYGIMFRPQLKAAATAFRDHGNTSNAIVSFLEGGFQKITVSGTTATFTLNDFPATGIAGTIRLWIRVNFAVNQTSLVLSLPSSVTLTGGIPGFDLGAKTMTFTSAGDHLIELTTVDGGVNFWIIKVA